MLTPPKIHTLFRLLSQNTPNAEIELNHSNPFQLLVAVVLSAQSTDKQVLRSIKPQIACTMSLADSLIKSNPTKTLADIKPITLKAISVYDEMFRAGIIPMELKK